MKSTKDIRRNPAREDAKSTGSGQYLTHADLLRIAKKNHCIGIHTEPLLALCRPAENFLGLQVHGLQIRQMSWLCRLRRRSSRQCLTPDLQPCRTANGGDPGSQPCPSQGLRHCSLFGRGVATLSPVTATGFESQPNASVRYIVSERSQSCE
jgi:hypothetical protein